MHAPNRSADVASVRKLGTDEMVGDPTKARNRQKDGLSGFLTQCFRATRYNPRAPSDATALDFVD
jgi:hypothetical protein